MITNYAVTGMTCQHCANAITEEVAEIPGVTNVEVSFEEAKMAVTSAETVDFDRILEAVQSAGDQYSLA